MSKLIIATRDLDYGVGSVVKKELVKMDKDRKIKKVIVIGPKKLKGYSEKIHFEVLPVKGKFFITKEPYFAFKCNFKIRELLKKEKIDKIITHFPIYAEDFNSGLIFKVHGLHKYSIKYLDCDIIHYFIAWFFHKIYSYFDYRTMKYANKILFVGRRFMRESKKYYPRFRKKFEYSSNEIDKSLFFKINKKERLKIKEELGINDDKTNLLFVGRLEPMKGIDLLLKAINDLDKKKVRLLVVGSGPLEKELKKYSFVKYFGRVNQSELYKYYNSADLFVFSSRYEPWGLVPYEALACGAKVLSTDVGDVRFSLKKESIIPPNDFLALKNKLRNFLK